MSVKLTLLELRVCPSYLSVVHPSSILQGHSGDSRWGARDAQLIDMGLCAEGKESFWVELLKSACFADEGSEWKLPLKNTKKEGDNNRSKPVPQREHTLFIASTLIQNNPMSGALPMQTNTKPRCLSGCYYSNTISAPKARSILHFPWQSLSKFTIKWNWHSWSSPSSLPFSWGFSFGCWI